MVPNRADISHLGGLRRPNRRQYCLRIGLKKGSRGDLYRCILFFAGLSPQEQNQRHGASGTSTCTPVPEGTSPKQDSPKKQNQRPQKKGATNSDRGPPHKKQFSVSRLWTIKGKSERLHLTDFQVTDPSKKNHNQNKQKRPGTGGRYRKYTRKPIRIQSKSNPNPNLTSKFGKENLRGRDHRQVQPGSGTQ